MRRALLFASLLVIATAPVAQAAADWRISSPSLTVVGTPSSLEVRPDEGRPLSFGDYYRREARAVLAGEMADLGDATVEYQLTPVAVADPLVSLQVEQWRILHGGIGPHIQRSFATFDTTGGLKRMRLLDLFKEADVVAALLQDGVIRARLAPGPRPKTLDALSRRLRDPADGSFWFPERWYDGFAFDHVKGRQVAVRIGLPGGNDANRGRLTQLGLYLPLPPRYAGALEWSQGEGRLMQKLKAGTARIAVTRGNSQPPQ